jgi:cell division protease FtsH
MTYNFRVSLAVSLNLGGILSESSPQKSLPSESQSGKEPAQAKSNQESSPQKSSGFNSLRQADGPGGNFSSFDNWLWYLFLSFWLAVLFSGFFNAAQTETISYSDFMGYVQRGCVNDLVVSSHEIRGNLLEAQSGKMPANSAKDSNKPTDKTNLQPVETKAGSKPNAVKIRKFRTIRVDDPQLAAKLEVNHIKFQGEIEDTFGKALLGWVLPVVFFVGMWSMIVRRFGPKDGSSSGGPPGFGFMSIEKNRARVYVESKVKTTFADVAGVDEAKEELQEVVGFLREPERYNRLGGHLPKGILLVGPPGTGKTLLARAVAGEAGVPFFSISGSEFVEMFVGVGAARVRDLFAQAQRSAPCIIFIDELDALGRARGVASLGGGHDEKEQTLNQLLVEMDGFDPRQGVVLLAATNRPEILDQALLRAGRFDRHVLVDRPDRIGREQILRVHVKGKSLDGASVNLEEIAATTAGFTGADLANLINEAVLLATRRGAEKVQGSDFTLALERIVAGLEKKNRLLNKLERERVAFHEMGHALVAMSLPGTDPIQKVSIIPRGIGALGYTMQRPTEDRFLMSQEELENKLAVLLGGRAAESLVFDSVSTGAADDLSKATDVARSMATRYGMVKELGPITYESDGQTILNGYQSPYPDSRHFSEETAREIDCAVRDLINDAQAKALEILTGRRGKLDEAAKLLLSKESLTGDELKRVCGE